jgi:hypothetical protein
MCGEVSKKGETTMKRIATTSSSIALPRNLIVSALAASCAIASLVAIKPAHAYGYDTRPAAYTLGSLANISVVDRNTGRTLPIYLHNGEYWLPGVPGNKYSVSINNRLNDRILAVVSVDGVNVLSGETAGVEQQGYVFNRYQRYDVAGWRKSDREIAAFTFVASPRSYAERTGRPENVGTIGVAVFRERPVMRWSPPSSRYEPRYDHDNDWRYRNERPQAKSGVAEGAPSAADAAGAAGAPPVLAAPAPAAESARGSDTQKRSYRGESYAQSAPSRVEEKLGTGHGAREYDSVTRTNFERASSAPAEVIRIRYDSYANLVAMGVIRDHHRPHDRSPNPFPDSFGNNGYVPDPPRWYR